VEKQPIGLSLKKKNIYGIFQMFAGMVKLVYTLALGASGETRGGSSPLPGTFLF
jgi:hypothetical protein